ncbi:MAG: outer membrane protein assembly factor BamA [Candidatus Omnitrophica bacterium]|nr:outer membrane protein assembly factor BamA [Candidatus Omnitrophota bacterium]
MAHYRHTKNIFIVLLIFILQLGFLFLAAKCPAEEIQKQKTITDITIEGNKAVSADTILMRIKTKQGRPFIQKQLDEDIKSLYSIGFFSDVSVKTQDYKDGVRVIFSVVEKSVIKKIVFQDRVSLREANLLKEMESKINSVLSERTLSYDVKKLKAYYHKKGFPLVDVSYRTEINADNEATVYIIIDEKMQYRIKKIIFKGNKALNDNALLAVMTTKTAWWFRSGILDTAALLDDIDKIKSFYQGKGYLDVTADDEAEYNKEQKGIFITIEINEGLQYTVGNIVLKGNTVFENNQISKELEMKKGAPYNPEQLRNDVIRIQTLYFDKGYMNCKAIPETLLDKNNQSIDIAYVITEGQINYVNMVRVTGNTKTKDVVIRREVRLYPGDKYEGEKLRRSKERLYNLGYFEEIIFDTEPTSEPDKKDLVVNVKEAKTGEFSFGGGYSSVDRLIGFVQVEQRNFDIMNFPNFTGAGQDFVLRGEFGTARRNYELSFTEPWMLGYPLSFGFDLYSLQTLRKTELGYGYDEEHQGGDLRLGKEFTDYDRADLKYTLEDVKISDVPSDASGALKDEEGKNTISTIALTLTRDTRSNKFSPIDGYLISGTGENGGGFIGGDKDFVKLRAMGSSYFNYATKLVLELRGEVGWVDKYDDSPTVPIYERFFAGGANSIRGYKERAIGPHDSNTGDPIGGNAIMIGNIELTYPIFKNFKIAAFYDIGNVWEKSNDLGNGDFKSGTGLGVRVNTPIGPVKIDAGYPLDEAHPGDKKKIRFHFSMTRGF